MIPITGPFRVLDHSTNSTNINIGALTVINPSDILCVASFKDDAYIWTFYSTIGTSINECY
jgi:hypothetical protein